jgi:hypothetical protein
MEKKIIIVGIVGSMLALGLAQGALAATLTLSPLSNAASVGQSFTESVYVSSPDQAINASQGVIDFPSDKLEVLSVSTAHSIFPLWVQQPSFSNKDGVVNFQGVIVNPGFQGSAGNIITVTFLARAAGSATISFDSGSVLANDGMGTNILTGMQDATVTLTATPFGGATNPGQGPLAITSIPDVGNGAWHNINSIEFLWTLPDGASAVNYAFSTSSDYVLPQNTAQNTVSNVTYGDLSSLPDGIWYFSVSAKQNGVWSRATTLAVYLDRTPPEPFTISRTDADLTDKQPVFTWATTDQLSGIAHYEVKIGNGDWFDAESIRQGSFYVLPPQSPTNARTLAVRAYDDAGNMREEDATFRVIGAACLTSCLYRSFQFLSAWDWLLVLVAMILVCIAYLFIWHLVLARRRLRHELDEFKAELRRDLKRLEGETGSKMDAGSLEKEARHLEGDVDGEIKKINKI